MSHAAAPRAGAADVGCAGAACGDACDREVEACLAADRERACSQVATASQDRQWMGAEAQGRFLRSLARGGRLPGTRERKNLIRSKNILD